MQKYENISKIHNKPTHAKTAIKAQMCSGISSKFESNNSLFPSIFTKLEIDFKNLKKSFKHLILSAKKKTKY